MDKETEALYDKGGRKPTCYKSRKWYMWKSLLNDKTCDICRKLHGKVLPRNAPQKDRTFYAVGYGVDAEEEGMTDFQKTIFKVEELLSW